MARQKKPEPHPVTGMRPAKDHLQYQRPIEADIERLVHTGNTKSLLAAVHTLRRRFLAIVELDGQTLPAPDSPDFWPKYNQLYQTSLESHVAGALHFGLHGIGYLLRIENWIRAGGDQFGSRVRALYRQDPVAAVELVMAGFWTGLCYERAEIAATKHTGGRRPDQDERNTRRNDALRSASYPSWVTNKELVEKAREILRLSHGEHMSFSAMKAHFEQTLREDSQELYAEIVGRNTPSRRTRSQIRSGRSAGKT